MPLLTRLSVVAAKVETVVGTAETLTAAEGTFSAYDADIQASIEVERREDEGTLNNLTGVAGSRIGVCKFKTDIFIGSGQPSWASTLFPGCGWVASTGVYTPRSEAPGSNVKTLTVGLFENGLYKSIAGAVGNFNIVLPTGKKGYIEWEFRGVWQAPVDSALIAPTNPTADALRFASGTATWGGVDMLTSQITINSGNQITDREDVSTAAGYISCLITDRQPKVTADPESELVGTDDRFGQWIANTEAALALSMDGPSSSSFAVAVPKAQITNVQEGNRNRLRTDSIEWMCNKNGTTKDQECSITITAEV